MKTEITEIKDTALKLQYSPEDDIKKWGKTIIENNLMKKEKWDSLTYFQQMCEISAIKESLNNAPSLLNILFGPNY